LKSSKRRAKLGAKQGGNMKKKIKQFMKEIWYLKNSSRINNFTGSGYRAKGKIQHSTLRHNKLRK
jgi:hypothetical protein